MSWRDFTSAISTQQAQAVDWNKRKMSHKKEKKNERCCQFYFTLSQIEKNYNVNTLQLPVFSLAALLIDLKSVHQKSATSQKTREEIRMGRKKIKTFSTKIFIAILYVVALKAKCFCIRGWHYFKFFMDKNKIESSIVKNCFLFLYSKHYIFFFFQILSKWNSLPCRYSSSPLRKSKKSLVIRHPWR